ncbi:hypothetical protein H6P81_019427 [Aristolochia fimbriata]|uniref:Uncharacterized protein n=1 Tax=Aristolochia fimbriata TaxID=158543 RepID=A0AAV7DUU5_ARIFI|nr:hypothetical protein H6P81_019427 [Aristolochia fimbriata]
MSKGADGSKMFMKTKKPYFNSFLLSYRLAVSNVETFSPERTRSKKGQTEEEGYVFFSQVSDNVDQKDDKESDSSCNYGNGEFGGEAFVDSKDSEVSPVAFGNGGESLSFESGELSRAFGDSTEGNDVGEAANVDDASLNAEAVKAHDNKLRMLYLFCKVV